jgi:hypothetical protein
VAAALSPLRSAIITLAPAAAKVRAMASPMFWAPPVTMATWPSMRKSAKGSKVLMQSFSG